MTFHKSRESILIQQNKKWKCELDRYKKLVQTYCDYTNCLKHECSDKFELMKVLYLRLIDYMQRSFINQESYCPTDMLISRLSYNAMSQRFINEDKVAHGDQYKDIHCENHLKSRLKMQDGEISILKQRIIILQEYISELEDKCINREMDLHESRKAHILEIFDRLMKVKNNTMFQ
ncbi:hypothetical protein GJ496_010454 [Pomphorhynchus laevis]|nr:hypothetical protein GJ496_010454 [Pomphorhynchus laevis]